MGYMPPDFHFRMVSFTLCNFYLKKTQRKQQQQNTPKKKKFFEIGPRPDVGLRAGDQVRKHMLRARGVEGRAVQALAP